MTLLCFTKKSEKVILQRQMLFEKLLNVQNAINVQITEHTVESTEFCFHVFFLIIPIHKAKSICTVCLR